MNDALLAILSVIGLLAVYWALMGQWKHNAQFAPKEENHPKKHPKE
jgi:hypothetical protein|tara:strand:- start:394 stop:531 length:138 start_codon:yes stop_codon:yes gene_type:complete